MTAVGKSFLGNRGKQAHASNPITLIRGITIAPGDL
jgi:hypothetical protein